MVGLKLSGSRVLWRPQEGRGALRTRSLRATGDLPNGYPTIPTPPPLQNGETVYFYA